MRKLKLDQNNIQELVAKTIEQLQVGTKNITLNVSALLNLPTPKPLEKPEVRFSLEAYHKMQALVNYCDKEICWHGLVEKVDDLSYYVYDILVYPQLATAATVEADEEEYVKWLDELEDEEFNAIRMQGHSHVNMTASPSGVDEDYYDVLRRHITDYYIYLIMNKSGKIWVNIYDIANNVVYETADVLVTKDGVDYGAWYHDMFKKYVKSKYTAPVKTVEIKSKYKEAPTDFDDYLTAQYMGRRGRY
jgi:hypothetical protein